MSKKMLKRSLALGALMAFVITGSVYAADAPITESFENGSGTLKITGTQGNGNAVKAGSGSDITISGYDAIVLDGDWTNYSGSNIDDRNIFYVSGKDAKLTIDVGDISFAGQVEKRESDGYPYGSIVFHLHKGTMNINADNIKLNEFCNGFYVQDEATMKVNANKINLTTQGTGAVIAVGSYANDTASPSLVIDTVDLTINAPNTTALQASKGKYNGVIGEETEGNIVVNATGTVDITAKTGISVYKGVSQTQKAGVTIDADIVTITGSEVAVKADTNAFVDVVATEKLTLAGKNAVLALGDGTEITLDGTKETSITGSVKVDGENGVASKIDVNLKGEKITIDADGNNYGMYAWGDYTPSGDQNTINLGDDTTKNITIRDFTYAGMLAYYDGSVIKVNADELNITGKGVGIWAANGTSEENPDGPTTNASVIIGADTATTINVDEVAISAMSEGVVDIKGALNATATNVIVTRGGATVNITPAEGKIVTLKGDVCFDYNANTSGTPVDANVKVNLKGEASKWEGNTKVSWNALDDEVYKVDNVPTAEELKVDRFELTLEDKATWKPTVVTEVGEYEADGTVKRYDDLDGKGEAEAKNYDGVRYTNLNSLNLVNGGIVDLTGNGNKKPQVVVDYVAGDAGTFKVDDVIAHQFIAVEHSDELVVTVEGSAEVADLIAAGTTIEEVAMTVTDGKATIVDVVKVEEGLVSGAVTAEINEDGEVVAGSVKEAVNTTNKAIGEAAVALKLHWRAHVNDMNKRMGELRMANGETGVWTRMVRGEAEYQGANAQYNQYQLGYDEKLSTDKRWTVGAAVTFAEGEGSFGKGTTEDDSTAFAIYGSKLNNDGTFVDLIARYAHMESDVTVGADKGDYDVNGYSVSAEFGKRIQQGKGFWIEPQVELTYGTVDSAEYVIGGKTVQVGDMDTLIGRVGFSLGKDIKQGNVYARASYLYDFDGETESTFGNGTVTRTIEEDLGGGWWEVGVGANINLSKATYIYADVEKTFGGEVGTNWQWNLGVRYSF